MKLKFKDGFIEYISIKKSFDIPEFKDFNVITGINGSGKTHFLKAIKNGDICVSIDEKDIDITDIGFFDYQNFKLENQNAVPYNFKKDIETRIFDALHSTKLFTQFNNIWVKLEEYFNGKKRYFIFQKLLNGGIDNIKLMGLNNAHLQNEWINIKQYFVNDTTIQWCKDNIDALKGTNTIITEYFGSMESIHSLSEEEINKAILEYQPKNFMEIGFGEVFKKVKDQYIKYLDEATDDKDKQQIRNSFQEKYGIFPWLFMNDIFKSFKEGEFAFKYEVQEPKEQANENLRPIINHIKTKEQVFFSNLSSGEKVLMALTLFLFQAKNNKYFPKILLLDEIDATLHPSMCRNLIKTLKENIVNKGTKIIFATHNPSTISFCDESTDGIFVKNGEEVRQVSKELAVDVLSDGIMTLNKGIKIFDQIFKSELTVISEGKNNKHIVHALDVLKYKNDKVSFYPFEDKAGGKGVSNLLGLFNLIKDLDFQSKVLFVFDWDSKNVKEEIEDTKKVFKFRFDKNEDNKIACKGIENLYSSRLFEGDFVKIITTGADKSLAPNTFNENEKDAFFEYIKEKKEPETFINFKPLIEHISKILKTKEIKK